MDNPYASPRSLINPERGELEQAASEWWGSRRARYNIALIVAGVAAAVSYLAIVYFFPSRLLCVEITAFTLAFQLLAYVVMIGIANVFYSLGAFIERFVEHSRIPAYRLIAYRAGFWFSVALPMIVPLGVLIQVWSRVSTEVIACE